MEPMMDEEFMDPMMDEELIEEPSPAKIAIFMILRRFFELTAWTAALSATTILMRYFEFADPEKILRVSLSLGVLIFILANWSMLRYCYFEVRNKKIYYLTNLASYILYAGFGLGLYLLWGKAGYTWAFAITRFLSTPFFFATNSLSVIIFHLITMLVILLAPLGMDRTIEEMDQMFAEELEEEEDDETRFLIPPTM